MTLSCEAVQRASGRSVLDAIGNTPLFRLARHRQGSSGSRALRQGRVAEPGRIGQGSTRGADDLRGDQVGQPHARAPHPRRDIGQYRYRLRDDRRRARLRRHALRAGQHHARAQADSRGLRTGVDLHGSARRIRRRDSRGAPPVCRRSRPRVSIPTSTTTRSTGAPITTRRPTRSGSRPRAASRISLPGLGTSGTFVGTGRRLRELNPAIVLASVQPDSPLHGLEGLKHMASAIVPGIYDPALADVDLGVSTEDAYVMTRRLAAEEGLLVGISSGANLAGALQLMQQRGSCAGPTGERPAVVRHHLSGWRRTLSLREFLETRRS